MMVSLSRTLCATFVCLICGYLYRCENKGFQNLDKKYQLVKSSFELAQNLFQQGQESYNALKAKSLEVIETFLDLVSMMNEEMARELRSSIVKFYKIKYFHDFTNYVISMEELIEIVEHCLVEPIEKVKNIREQFHAVIRNFHDSRNFNNVNQCAQELPDEVAAAHCILHQAVLFNETMQDSLVTIVEIKTRQHVEEMNNTLFSVHKCLNDFIPNFFEQLLVDAYTESCGYLKIINASINDLMKDKWKSNTTVFSQKWSPLVKLLKERLGASEPLLRDTSIDSLVKASFSVAPDFRSLRYEVWPNSAEL